MSSHARAQESAGDPARFSRDFLRAADSDTTVLIEGEHGSGKSTTARLLHAKSRRAAGVLVAADLAALPPSLLSAELFGSAPGAFTGAIVERQGRFRRAAGGTLVLEGIENLPLEQQVVLLRVLQEREVEPLGAEAAFPIDVRVVATTTRSLESEVAAGRFRQDLYWRLAVVVLRVPPLRARLGELGALVAELGPAAAARAGVPVRPLGSAAMQRLAQHSWPGNLRELENALERVMVLGASASDGSTLRPVDAEEFGFLDEELDGAATRLAREALAHGLTVASLNAALLEEALREHRGNHTAAARQLGLSRRAFEYRLAHQREPETPGGEESA
jgi:DNA-binding NtrC family response regulator